MDNPAFWPLALVAVAVAGISKGGFGGGLGVVAVPLISLATSPAIAAGIMLPVLCVMDLTGVAAYRRSWDRATMVILAPAAVVGVTVGAATFRYFSTAQLRLLIGLVALGATGHWLAKTFGRARPAEPLPPHRVAGSFWAAVAGFTSFVAHAGGPPLNVYLLRRGLDKTTYQATTVVFFAAVNYAKLIPYGWLGLLRTDVLGTSLVLLPAAPLAIAAGVWLNRRIPAALYARLCYAFLGLTGVKLVADGVRGMVG